MRHDDGGHLERDDFAHRVLRLNWHESIACELLYSSADSLEWRRKPMAAKRNGCWGAEFPVDSLGRYFYTVQGSVDRFNTWHAGLRKRIAAGQELSVELPIGAELVEQAANRARGEDVARLRRWAESFPAGNSAVAESEDLLAAMRRYPGPSLATKFGRDLSMTVRHIFMEA